MLESQHIFACWSLPIVQFENVCIGLIINKFSCYDIKKSIGVTKQLRVKTITLPLEALF